MMWICTNYCVCICTSLCLLSRPRVFRQRIRSSSASRGPLLANTTLTVLRFFGICIRTCIHMYIYVKSKNIWWYCWIVDVPYYILLICNTYMYVCTIIFTFREVYADDECFTTYCIWCIGMFVSALWLLPVWGEFRCTCTYAGFGAGMSIRRIHTLQQNEHHICWPIHYVRTCRYIVNSISILYTIVGCVFYNFGRRSKYR